MSKPNVYTDNFKSNLSCIFLSVRAKLKKNTALGQCVALPLSSYLHICFQVSVRNSDRLSEISTTFKQKEKVSSLSELRSILNQLWIDDGILRCFKRRNEFQLIDSAEYFLDKVCSKAFKIVSRQALKNTMYCHLKSYSCTSNTSTRILPEVS